WSPGIHFGGNPVFRREQSFLSNGDDALMCMPSDCRTVPKDEGNGLFRCCWIMFPQAGTFTQKVLQTMPRGVPGATAGDRCQARSSSKRIVLFHRRMRLLLVLASCVVLFATDFAGLRQLEENHRMFELRAELDRPGENFGEALLCRAIALSRFG